MKREPPASSRAARLLLAAAAGFSRPELPTSIRPQMPRSLRLRPQCESDRSKYRPHEGEQERARRRRQIERGILTAANGLVTPSNKRTKR